MAYSSLVFCLENNSEKCALIIILILLYTDNNKNNVKWIISQRNTSTKSMKKHQIKKKLALKVVNYFIVMSLNYRYNIC